jgi:hypothetical protein
MKIKNNKGFGARPATSVYYVIVPNGTPGKGLKVGPIASRERANAFAERVSLSPDFSGLAIGVEEVAA